MGGVSPDVPRGSKANRSAKVGGLFVTGRGYVVIRVLQAINGFLAVKELAGRRVKVSVLKEFGLTENKKTDDLLGTVFGRGVGSDRRGYRLVNRST